MSKIAIVGASIAGRIAAIVLQRLGHHITVFEKSSPKPYPDRGAGIWLPPQLIQSLISKNILSENFPFLPIISRPIYRYDSTTHAENLLTTHAINAAAVHWLDLYEDLKKHSPEMSVRYNSEVTQINSDGNIVNLTINASSNHDFDYCIFADGGQSTGRAYLYPESKPSFTNTYIWRGVLNKTDIADADRILQCGTFYVTPRGHMLIYPVPNHTSPYPLEDYKINWLFYENVDDGHPLFRDNKEDAQKNIVKGQMLPVYQAYLYNLARSFLPQFPSDIILRTVEPFAQAMHEMLIPRYTVKNICLLGDASIMLRAHTAAGVTKTILDTLALEEQLLRTPNIHVAFEQWDITRQAYGQKQFILGQNLGKLFVTAMPNWSLFTKQRMNEEWEALVSDDTCWYAYK